MGGNGNGNGGHVDLASRPELEIYVEVLREALGEVLAHERRNWQREKARMQAEANEIVAKLRAEVAELRGTITRMVDEQLARMRDMRGPPGERGEQGLPGRLPIVTTWKADQISYEGDVVSHSGATWQATKDTGQEPGGRDWICLARAGHDGASLQVRGTYREGTAYKALDIVALNGGSFIARKDDPGPCPGGEWQAMSLPGKRGERGERGPKGDQGDPGVSFIDWKLDRENYAVRVVLSDGTVLTLELRELFEQYQLETH